MILQLCLGTEEEEDEKCCVTPFFYPVKLPSEHGEWIRRAGLWRVQKGLNAINSRELYCFGRLPCCSSDYKHVGQAFKHYLILSKITITITWPAKG